MNIIVKGIVAGTGGGRWGESVSEYESELGYFMVDWVGTEHRRSKRFERTPSCDAGLPEARCRAHDFRLRHSHLLKLPLSSNLLPPALPSPR